MANELKTRHVAAGSNPHGDTIDQWLAPNAPAWVCNEVVRLREALAEAHGDLQIMQADRDAADESRSMERASKLKARDIAESFRAAAGMTAHPLPWKPRHSSPEGETA